MAVILELQLAQQINTTTRILIFIHLSECITESRTLISLTIIHYTIYC